MLTYSAYGVLLLDYINPELTIKKVKIDDRLTFSVLSSDEMEFSSFPSKTYGLLECKYNETNWTSFEEADNPIFKFVSAMRLVNKNANKLYIDAIYDYDHDKEIYNKVYSDWVLPSTQFYELYEASLDEIVQLYNFIVRIKDNKLYDSLVIYQDYVNERDAGWEFVKLFSILEMLFPPKNKWYIGKQLAQYLSEYITENLEEQKKIRDKVEKYYKVRNKLIHSSKYEKNKSVYFETEILDKYIREVIKNKLSKYF